MDSTEGNVLDKVLKLVSTNYEVAMINAKAIMKINGDLTATVFCQ